MRQGGGNLTADPVARDTIAACEDILRRHSSTFYLGSRLLAGERRAAVTVVYAICRVGDDAVDEATGVPGGSARAPAPRHPGAALTPAEVALPPAGAPLSAAEADLEAWWAGIERAYAGTPRAGARLEVGLHWVLQRFAVPYEAWAELYLGLRSDVAPRAIATVDELMTYCHRVAGVVGLLVAPIVGYRGGEGTLELAVALGQAMQLTNVLRDVGEDLDRGRCYLPGELLERHGVTIDALRQGLVSEGYVALLEDLAARAHALYRQAWRGIPRLEGVSAAAVGVAALNYEGILRKLRQNGHDNLTRRARLRRIERLATIPRALAGLVMTAP